MSARTGDTPLVGRDAELAQLRARLDAAGLGQGGTVLLAGEAGIGKTRLLRELAGYARARGWQVLSGAAYEAGGMPPYLPFAEALRDHVRACSAEALRVQLGDGGAEVALLVPAVRSRLPDLPTSPPLSPELQRYQLFESVTDFLIAIAQNSRPAGLLLLLDDLHWADTPTLLLLQHVAHRIHDAPLMIVGAYRGSEARPGDEGGLGLADVVLDLRRGRHADELRLQALSVQQSATLIESLTGIEAAPAVVAAIYRETEGNPFFLEELTHQLAAEQRNLADPAALSASWSIPEGVRQVIGRRLARLSEPALRLVQAAAVIGDPFTFDLLGDFTKLDLPQLLDALEEALGASIIREERDGYRFAHALIRETLARAISQARRELLHARAATVLSARYADDLTPYLGAIAAHYRQAGVAYRASALAFTQQAAEAATSVFAWEDAAAQWEAALPLLRPADEARRCDVLVALGEAHLRAGAVNLAAETFQEAAERAGRLGRTEIVTSAALIFGATELAGGSVDPRQVRLLEDALALVGDAETPVHAMLLASLVHVLFWSPDGARREALSEAALALARRTGDAAALATAVSARRRVVWTPDNAEERLALADEMLRLAEAAGDVELALQAQRWRVVDLIELGEIESADAAIAAYRRLAEELRQPFYLYYARLLQAMRALLSGRFDEGLRLAEETYALGQRTDNPYALAFFATQTWEARRAQGRIDVLLPELEALIKRFPTVISYRTAVALLHAETGQFAEAHREFDVLAAEDFENVPRTWVWLSSLFWLSEVCATLADAPRAEKLYRMLLPYEGRCVPTAAIGTCLGPVTYSLGRLATVLARFDAARSHFERALTQLERMGARAKLAETRAAYAQMLLGEHQATCVGGGRPGRDCEHNARAAGLCAQALGVAQELGMAPLVERLTALRAAASRVAGTATEGAAGTAAGEPSGLSGREVEVLRLLAAGLTNKEIAQQLVIAPPTVARHIASIYTKIDARRRADAAAYAIRQGLVPVS